MRRSKSAHKNANSSRRQTNYIQIGYINTLSCTEFAFYQIHHKRVWSKKGISIPKKQNTPKCCIFSLFGITIISHFLRFVNIFREVLSHYLPGGKKTFLREEGGTRSVTEGACAIYEFDKNYFAARSLTRLRRELPPGGSLFMFIYGLSIFLTSTAFVSTNAKYGIPLWRYTVFLQNCPLE